MQSLFIFLIQLILLFFLSRQTTKELFYFFRIFVKNNKAVFSFVSLIFFPGTLLHEIAHFLAATICMLRVREVSIFPEFKGNYIRLGSVIYEKKDFVRGIIVGIAPIFMGLIFFFILTTFKLFPSNNLLMNLIFGYLIFAVSSTMFSSKQDLVDLIYIIPLFIVIGIIMFIFNLNLNFLLEYQYLLKDSAVFINKLNFYLFFSIIINLGIIILLKGISFAVSSRAK